jgi:glycosyltransferase involved in cell wall biosynthesis
MAFGRALGRPGGSIAHRLAMTLRKRAPRLLARLAKSRSRAAGRRGPTAADIDARLDAARSAASEFDLLIGPSPSIVAEFKVLGIAMGRLDVADYGFRALPLSGPTSSESGGNRALRVGYVGTLVWHKGVHVLIDAIRQMPANQAEVWIFGDADTFPDYTAELRASARGLPVRFMGRFERHRAADIYSQLDVLVVPSLWLENSPLVIHEAFMAGVPVVGARIGGITDLIRDGENGLLYAPESSSALASALSRLATDRSRLRALRARPTPVRSIDDDAVEWERRYLSLTMSEGPDRRAS